jgi:hypothetical protein
MTEKPWRYPLAPDEFAISREEGIKKLQGHYEDALRKAKAAGIERYFSSVRDSLWDRLRNYEVAHRLDEIFPREDGKRWRVAPPCPINGDYC